MKVPMTPGGLQHLQDELRRLKTEERPAVIRAIAEARAHGDLSENAEYHAAKERQAFIEGRVGELEDKISRAVVIDPKKMSGSTVMFGAVVTVVDEENEERIHLPDRRHGRSRTSRRGCCPSPLRSPAP